MPVLTVRNLSDEAHRALRVRAAQHGRSTEAEVRDILETAARPPERLRMGDALAELGQRIGLTNEDWGAIEESRDRSPIEPMSFEE